MKTVTLDPDRTRYLLPFPRLARALGGCLLVSGPLMLLAGLAAGLRGAPLLAFGLAAVVDIVFGALLLGGSRYIETDRVARRLVLGHASFGLDLPLGRRALPVDDSTQLIVAARNDVHDVGLRQAQRTLRLLSFANADNARRFAGLLATALRLEVAPGGRA